MKEDFCQGKGKKRVELGKLIYDTVNKAVEDKLLPNPNDENCPPFITCEFVGKKHQMNRDDFPFDHGLVPHYEPFVSVHASIRPKSFEDAEVLFKEKCFEGLVYQHPDGTRYKLRADMFRDNKWNKGGKTDVRPTSSLSY